MPPCALGSPADKISARYEPLLFRSLPDKTGTGYWLELLVDAKIVSSDKLQPLRQEWSEWGERHKRYSREVAESEWVASESMR